MKKYILSFLVSTLLFCGCKKDKSDSPLLFIDPQDIVLDHSMGEVVSFKISATAPAGLSSLSISYKQTGTFTQAILDSTLNGGSQSFSWNYEYKIPSGSAAYVMDIYFNLTDKNGTTISAARRINVALTNNALSEYSGNVFYSKRSGHEDSYDLINRTALYSTTAAATVRTIQNDGTYDSVDSLARSWVSPSGSKFVRFNGFDYDNATYLAVVNSYNSGIKTDTIRNLQQGDIILTKITRNNTDSYVAIKLTSIFDVAGSNNDTYIFNLKK